MIILNACMLLCSVISMHAMHLDDMYPDVFNKICYYVDPEGYYNQFQGDILFIAPQKMRSYKDPLAYEIPTDFKALACVNKNASEQVKKFLNTFKPIYLKEQFYKKAVIHFLKNRSIEFFIKQININGDEYNIGAKLKSEVFFGDIEYNLEIFADALNNKNNRFHVHLSSIENFFGMLSLCTDNKEWICKFKNAIEDVDSKQLITLICNTRDELCYTYTKYLYGSWLKFTRKVDDHANWNVFSLSLFCQLANFAEKIVSSDE